MELIDKDALVAEIERLIKKNELYLDDNVSDSVRFQKTGAYSVLDDLLHFIDTLEVKEAAEYEQPEHGYFDTIYRCGKKPRWNTGDTLAYYEFYADREGECVLGKVIKVSFDEDYSDWSYTFEDGDVLYEGFLLSEETYKL